MFWLKLVALLAGLVHSPQPAQSRTEAPPRDQPVRACDTQFVFCNPSQAAYAAYQAAAQPLILQCAASGNAFAVAPGAPTAVAAFAPVAVAGDDDDQDADDDDTPPPPKRKPLKFADQNTPWIGVTLAPVPAVLGSHLNLDGEHLMIFNVAEDSPADKAGIEQYDVIVAFNGKSVGGKADEFSGRIRKLALGDKAELVIVRGGAKKTLSIVPVRRPNLDTIKYKYKVEPQDEVVDTQESRGMMLRRAPDGQWQMLPFAPPAPPGTPVPPVPPTPGMPAIPPTPPMMRFDLFGGGFPGGDSSFVIVESRDGQTTEIRRDANGEFRVSRSADGAKEKSKVRSFKSADELQKGDPDAYAMYRRLRDRSPQAQAWNWSVPAPNNAAVQQEMERARKEIERALAAAQQANRQSQSFQFAHPGRPDIRITVDEDGRIKVVTRDGDQELVQTFKNADDLKAQRPKLYERYRKLNEANPDDDE